MCVGRRKRKRGCKPFRGTCRHFLSGPFEGCWIYYMVIGSGLKILTAQLPGWGVGMTDSASKSTSVASQCSLGEAMHTAALGTQTWRR